MDWHGLFFLATPVQNDKQQMTHDLINGHLVVLLLNVIYRREFLHVQKLYLKRIRTSVMEISLENWAKAGFENISGDISQTKYYLAV